MTETEKKALALLNEVRDERGFRLNVEMQREDMAQEALCRAIEQHEAFRQEVSDAVGYAIPLIETWVGNSDEAGRKAADRLRRFIIAKPDPLVEVIADYKRTKGTGEYATNKDMANAIRAALDARGLEIREKQP